MSNFQPKASYVNNTAWLSTDFGVELACKWFNLSIEELEQKVGRYKKGKRKGKLKGLISWYKVTSCGWVSCGPKVEYPDGFVIKHKGICFAKAIYVPNWLNPSTFIMGLDTENNNGYGLEQNLKEEYKNFLEEL